MTSEDLEIWHRVAKSVAPLPTQLSRPRADRVAKTESRDDASEAAFREYLAGRVRETDGAAETAADISLHRKPPAPASSTQRAAQAPQKPAGANLPHLDRKLARRLSRGTEPLDARLDLHGFRQADAHAALRRFLFRCAATGHRNVLIITGKGSGQSKSDSAGFETKPGDTERGVLRRNLPRWLADPDLRPLVVGFDEAGARHGGRGAFYVRLRSRS